MKKLILVAFLVLPLLSRGQDSIALFQDPAAPVTYARKSVWRVVFLGLGVVNESRLGSQWTLVSEARLTTGINARQTTLSTGQTQQDVAYSLNPTLAVSGRYYYNFERRLERGKSIRYNSGNYLSLRARGVLPPVVKRTAPNLGINLTGVGLEALWGFQRTYRRNFYLNLALGAGIYRGTTGGAGDFTIGYTFPSRQYH